MNKESLFLIKPSEDREKISQEAVAMAEQFGLMVTLLAKKVLTKEEAVKLYEPYKDEFWFPPFAEYLTSGEIEAYSTTGDMAIEKTLEVKTKIREKYAKNRQQNAIHAPKTEQDFNNNIIIFERK